MLTPKPFLDFLRLKGRPLKEIDPSSCEVALTPQSALWAIDLLNGSHIAILGGDVLTEQEDRLSYTHENWHCDQFHGENLVKFAERSRAVSREFVSNLNKRGEQKLFVVIVHSELGVS